MVRRLCIFMLLLPTATVGLAQLARANPVTSCDNPADSALNQYCETVPSTGGGQRPTSGTPALGSSLPAPIVRQIVTPAAGHRARHRRLLTIPAPTRHLKAAASSRQTVAATAGLSTWTIVIVAALALALAAGVMLDRRRRRASSA
jgi:hypothetical protein